MLKKKLAGLMSAQCVVWPGPRLRPSSARLAPSNLSWLTLSGICEPRAEPWPHLLLLVEMEEMETQTPELFMGFCVLFLRVLRAAWGTPVAVLPLVLLANAVSAGSEEKHTPRLLLEKRTGITSR